MFKAFLNYILHYRPFFKIIRLLIGAELGVYQGTNELKREVPVVISLFSDENHFDNLGFTVYSLLTQKIKPDRLILWLSDEYELSELPYNVTKYIKNGLEVRFVKDKGEYTPVYYAFKEFKHTILVQASDKMIYPSGWLGKLYHSYIAYPKDIHVHQAFDIISEKEPQGKLTVNREFVTGEDGKYNNLGVIEGGILYPPNSFSADVLREDIYKNKLNLTPDLWLWCMAVVSKRKIRIVKNHIKTFGTTAFFKGMYEFIKKSGYSAESAAKNSKLLEYYGQNIKNNL